MSPRLAGPALALAVLLSACAPSSPVASPTPSAIVAPTASAKPSAPAPEALLKVGDCTGSVDLTGASITSLPTVPCTDPHNWEVHASLRVSGDLFPGLTALTEQAKRACSAICRASPWTGTMISGRTQRYISASSGRPG